jgi:DNA-binding response OmpR family regulator
MGNRILIVEDDGATRAGLEELLSAVGYEVTAVATVPAGMQALRADAPDLLIADVRVDGYNGLQLAVAGTHPVRAIIITGFPDPVIEAEARQAGADFLLKPVSPQALLALVAERIRTGAAAAFSSVRRWPRTPLSGTLTAETVAALNARILDVSYGGLRIEVDAAHADTLPASFKVRVPAAAMALDVDVVWKSPAAEGLWLCGLAVSDPYTAGWRQLIDQLSCQTPA